MIDTKLGRYVRPITICVISIFAATYTTADRASEAQLRLLRVAVATNFAPVLNEIAKEFEETRNVELRVITGSTGKLYAQITNGLEVDLFLSADQVRIRRLVDIDMAIENSLTTYAEGRLVWWQSRSHPPIDPQKQFDIGDEIRVIAYAQPELAPYGKAAEQALSKCFHLNRSQIRFVHGENVGQAYAHVATGNADAGVVALASIKLADGGSHGAYFNVPRSCHDPIRQDAVILKSSRSVVAAGEFLQFLQSEKVQQRIAEYGYELP